MNSLNKTIMFSILLCAAAFVFACVPPVYSPTENVTINTVWSSGLYPEIDRGPSRNRQSQRLRAENTLAAYDIAWNMGASVEIDVRSTQRWRACNHA